jgi:hypothetical protein
MKRSEFILLLGGAGGCLAARGTRAAASRTRRVGILMPLTADDPEDQARRAAFLQGVQETGWSGTKRRITGLIADGRFWGEADMPRPRAP